jgi:hypothetical protein
MNMNPQTCSFFNLFLHMNEENKKTTPLEETPYLLTKEPTKSLRGFCSYHGGVNETRTACNDGTPFITDPKKLVTYIQENATNPDEVREMLKEGKKGLLRDGLIVNQDTSPILKEDGTQLTTADLDQEVSRRQADKLLQERIEQGLYTPVAESQGEVASLGDYLPSGRNKYAWQDEIEDVIKLLSSEINTAIKNQESETARVLGKKVGNSILINKGYYEANELWQHSLQDNPRDLHFGQNNSICMQIRKSDEYNDYVDELIRQANKQGLDSISFNSLNDELVDDNGNSEHIQFNEGNLKYAIHGVDGGMQVKGHKNQNGQWELEIEMNDTYDFHKRGYQEEDGSFSGALMLNDTAYKMQKIGAINSFNSQFAFKDVR